MHSQHSRIMRVRTPLNETTPFESLQHPGDGWWFDAQSTRETRLPQPGLRPDRQQQQILTRVQPVRREQCRQCGAVLSGEGVQGRAEGVWSHGHHVVEYPEKLHPRVVREQERRLSGMSPTVLPRIEAIPHLAYRPASPECRAFIILT